MLNVRILWPRPEGHLEDERRVMHERTRWREREEYTAKVVPARMLHAPVPHEAFVVANQVAATWITELEQLGGVVIAGTRVEVHWAPDDIAGGEAWLKAVR